MIAARRHARNPICRLLRLKEGALGVHPLPASLIHSAWIDGGLPKNEGYSDDKTASARRSLRPESDDSRCHISMTHAVDICGRYFHHWKRYQRCMELLCTYLQIDRVGIVSESCLYFGLGLLGLCRRRQ